MKLPIQAQPVFRKASSAMSYKKATNAIGASQSSACTSQCGWAALACLGSAAAGPPGIITCLAAIGAADCFPCVLELITPPPPPPPLPPGVPFPRPPFPPPR